MQGYIMVIKIFIVLFSGLVIWKILGTDFKFSSKKVIVRKVPSMNIDYAITEAQTYLNQIRQNMQISLLSKNVYLEKAAQAHAEYMVINNELGHEEIEKHRGFVGKKPWDRAFTYGYFSSHLQITKNNPEFKLN